MKISFLALLFIPMLSFGQEVAEHQPDLSKKEKNKIESFAVDMCECMNGVMSELHPKTIEVILVMGAEGQEEGMKKFEEIFLEMDIDEQEKFLNSFGKLDTPEFTDQMDKCDVSDELGEDLRTRVDTSGSDANEYLETFIRSDENCTLVNALLNLSDMP